MKKTVKIYKNKGVYSHELTYPIGENSDIVLDKIDSLRKKYKGIYKTKGFYKIKNKQPKEIIMVPDLYSFNAICRGKGVIEKFIEKEVYRCDHVYYLTIYYKKKRKKKEKKKKDNPLNCFGDPIIPPHCMGRLLPE